MTRPVRFSEREIATAIRAAIKGGLEPGSFAVVVSPGTGELRILPARAEPAQGDALDRELAEWRTRNGHG